MPIKVEIITSDRKEDLFTACEILYKLRYYSKIWHEKYGAENRLKMERWQKRADEFLEQKVKEICPQDKVDTLILPKKTNGSI